MNRKMAIGAVGVLVLVSAVGIGLAATTGQFSAAEPDISEEKAKSIAANHVNGTAQSVALEQENGPVYEVTVEQSDGDLKEVEVDGNSGEVLEVEKADGEENEGKDGDDN